MRRVNKLRNLPADTPTSACGKRQIDASQPTLLSTSLWQTGRHFLQSADIRERRVPSLLETSRVRSEFQLLRIVSDHPDVVLVETLITAGLDIQRESDLRARMPLKLGYHCVHDGLKGLDRANCVDLAGPEEAPWLSVRQRDRRRFTAAFRGSRSHRLSRLGDGPAVVARWTRGFRRNFLAHNDGRAGKCSPRKLAEY